MRRLRDKRKRLEMRRWFQAYKALLKCKVCGEKHPATIDFHHKKNSKTKFMEVAVMVSQAPKFRKKRILEEIAKCTVLCANCHRKLHWERSH